MVSPEVGLLSRTDALANLALTIAALTIAGVVGAREYRRSVVTTTPLPDHQAEHVAEWRTIVAPGIRLGSTMAPIQVIEFTDLECPYCARFHLNTLRELYKQFPAKINTIIVHFPIRSHRFAMQSAVALECASEQGAPGAFLELATQLNVFFARAGMIRVV